MKNYKIYITCIVYLILAFCTQIILMMIDLPYSIYRDVFTMISLIIAVIVTCDLANSIDRLNSKFQASLIEKNRELEKRLAGDNIIEDLKLANRININKLKEHDSIQKDQLHRLNRQKETIKEKSKSVEHLTSLIRDFSKTHKSEKFRNHFHEIINDQRP